MFIFYSLILYIEFSKPPKIAITVPSEIFLVSVSVRFEALLRVPIGLGPFSSSFKVKKKKGCIFVFILITLACTHFQ